MPTPAPARRASPMRSRGGGGRGGGWAAEAGRRPARGVFVCSTGVIGHRLPMEKIRRGVRQAAQNLSAEGGRNAALAIMTTDRRPKERAAAFTVDGVRLTVGGMAKG